MTLRKAMDRAANTGFRGFPVLALAASVLVAAIATACSSQAEPSAAMPPPEVSVAQVLSKQVNRWDDPASARTRAELLELLHDVIRQDLGRTLPVICQAG